MKKDLVVTDDKNEKKSFLNVFDRKIIKNQKRSTELKQELYKSKKQKNALKKAIEIDKIMDEGDKLDQINRIAPKKIKNARTQNQLSRLQRAIDFNNEVNDNQKKEIARTLKRGSKFKFVSMIASIASSITTCLGIKGEMADWMWLICSCIIIFCAIAVNLNINSTIDFIKKFFNGMADGCLFSFKLILIVSYTTYSIVTNFTFWSFYMSGISVVMFSVIFDIIAVEMSLEGEKMKNLEYNNKFKDEINGIMFETEEVEDDVKNTSKLKKPKSA